MTTAISFNARWRLGDNFRIADVIKDLFADFLPADCLATALATCRFCFQGPKSVGATGKKKNWGHWVRTRMQSSGNFPNGFGVNRDYACQRQGNQWVSLDSHEVVAQMLAHVGLTLEDVYNRYGRPEQGEKYVVDLITIIRDMAPDCLTGMPAVAVA